MERQVQDGNRLSLPVGARDHGRGPQTAQVTLVEYGDYQCGRCAQAYVLLQDYQQRQGEALRFVFRHFPQSQIHPQAQNAAEAAEAAGAQNKYWQMHALLFERQQALENGFLVEYAEALGLDTTRFLREMAQHTYADRVRDDFRSGMQSGVNGTPTFFINGVRYEEIWSEEGLIAAIEDVA